MFKINPHAPLCVLLAALILLAALCSAGCGLFSPEEEHRASPTYFPAGQQIQSEEPAFLGASDETPDASQTFREATVYYRSDEGYIVPVKKLIPWEEGIARACLGYMVSTPANDLAASELGLNTVLPAGVSFTLAIDNGEAKLDLIGLAPLAAAADEAAMLEAVINTLTEFASVSTVTVTVEGRGGALANGTELPVRSPRVALNVEQQELAASSGAAPSTLWFPNMSGAISVPVTRYFSSEPSLYKKVAALIEGPVTEGLRCCFPNGTLLLGATLENGVVTVNLSEDFKQVADTYGLYTLACRTLALTLAEDFTFDKLVTQVNGTDYMPENIED